MSKRKASEGETSKAKKAKKAKAKPDEKDEKKEKKKATDLSDVILAQINKAEGKEEKASKKKKEGKDDKEGKKKSKEKTSQKYMIRALVEGRPCCWIAGKFESSTQARKAFRELLHKKYLPSMSVKDFNKFVKTESKVFEADKRSATLHAYINQAIDTAVVDTLSKFGEAAMEGPLPCDAWKDKKPKAPKKPKADKAKKKAEAPPSVQV